MQENHRFTVSVPDDLLQQLEQYMIENRISTKGKAVAELVKIGLASKLDKPIALEGAPPSLTDIEQECLDLFRVLDERDQERMLGRMEGLADSEKYKKKKNQAG